MGQPIGRSEGRCVLSTLVSALRENWDWRKQIGNLAVFDLVKKSRGSVLSWAWLLIRPAVYMFCFWFALDVGLRGGSRVEPGMPPYFLWLCAGIVPWFFIQEELSGGIDVFRRYSYLVNKIKFPISAIPTFTSLSAMIIQLVLQAFLIIIYFVNGQPLGVFLIQVPLLLLLMLVFWTMVSFLFSTLSAISRDFANFMKAMSTPIFWLSGVIFDVSNISIGWIHTILLFNPVTFFIQAFRDVYYYGRWFWEDAAAFGCFVGVFVVTLMVTLFIVRKFSKEVPDVL